MPLRRHLLLAAATLLAATPLAAQFTWTGGSPVDGYLGLGLNWVGGVPPTGLTGTEDVVFGPTSGQTTLLVPTAGLHDVTFGTGRPLYTLEGDGGPETLTLTGNILVEAGATVSTSTSLDFNLTAGAHTVTVNSSGFSPTFLEVSGDIIGAGSLVKAGVGTVAGMDLGVLILLGQNTYAGGTTLTGGSLHVADGGSVVHTSADTVLDAPDASGGQLEIYNDGLLSNANGYLGLGAGNRGLAMVYDDGSWLSAGDLKVGFGGTGTLLVDTQGTVTVGGIFFVGYNSGAIGSVMVSDSGSQINAGSAVIGRSGSGVLNIGAGSMMDVGGSLTVGEMTGSTGVVGVVGEESDGAAIDVGGGVIIGASGSGHLVLGAGGWLNVGAGEGTVTLAANAGSTGALIIGNETLSPVGGGIVNAAEVTSGSGVGMLAFATAGTGAPLTYYFTNDGTAEGTPVKITGTTNVAHYSGTTVLMGQNTYTGTTAIAGGTLIAHSDAIANSDVLVNGGSLVLAQGEFNNEITVGGGASLVLQDSSLYQSPTLISGRLAGTGFLTSTTIGANVTLAPGFSGESAVGVMLFDHLELAPGGTMEWHLNDPNGEDGVGWDRVDAITPQTLDITATSANRFTLKLISLDSEGDPGTPSGFNSGQSYHWLMFNTDNIQGFAADKFTLDASSFFLDLGGGTLSVGRIGTQMFLDFTPVPEPSTWALLGLGLAGAGWRTWRQRRRT